MINFFFFKSIRGKTHLACKSLLSFQRCFIAKDSFQWWQIYNTRAPAGCLLSLKVLQGFPTLVRHGRISLSGSQHIKCLLIWNMCPGPENKHWLLQLWSFLTIEMSCGIMVNLKGEEIRFLEEVVCERRKLQRVSRNLSVASKPNQPQQSENSMESRT